MSRYKLFLGDCLEVMKKIPDNFVNFICCDLPFGSTDSSWDKMLNSEKLWEQYNRILTSVGTVALFANGLFTPRLMLSNLKAYKYKWVWIKKNSTNFVHAKNRPMTLYEEILIFSKGSMGHKSQLGDRRMTYNPQGLIPCHKVQKQGHARFGTVAGNRPSHLNPEDVYVREYTNYPTDVLTQFSDLPPNKKLHTNEKPVELLEYLVKTYTYENEVVLDNCMGSGSCGVACLNTNRKFIGIELNEKYFNVAKKRIEDM